MWAVFTLLRCTIYPIKMLRKMYYIEINIHIYMWGSNKYYKVVKTIDLSKYTAHVLYSDDNVNVLIVSSHRHVCTSIPSI